jgi:YfiH family protein
VAFTERTGGASPAPFDSLNLGYRTGDRSERVNRNRRLAVTALGMPPFTVGEQVHGARIARVGERRAGAGFDRVAGAIPSTDALSVTSTRLPVAILVADCVPLVLAAPGLLVAVHAGWRGLAAGIVDRAVGLFAHGLRPAAAVGPAIGPCHYEVGDEVLEAFADIDGAASARMLDLRTVIVAKLAAAGVTDVQHVDRCTSCEPELYFSHRRDGGVTGRQAGIIVRDGS